jgi:glycosyltransferase involved in cell wall biosynthesis
VDTRKLPVDELVGLYNDSHAFLFPSLGEGWGLTLTEAMATGLPCISIDKTGCAEYFDNSVGFVIKSDVKSIGPLPNYGLEDCRAYVPDTQSLLDAMILCCNRYQDALKKGRKASDWIRNNVTWEKAGVRLANILTEITEREISPCGT